MSLEYDPEETVSDGEAAKSIDFEEAGWDIYRYELYTQLNCRSIVKVQIQT